MNRTSTEIRSAIDSFLETWDRNHWLYHHGDWTDDGETMISRVVDPGSVAKSADELGVEEDYQCWNCNEMWEAYRAGDALYMRWQRYSCCGERIPRDLWVLVDAAYFPPTGDC